MTRSNRVWMVTRAAAVAVAASALWSANAVSAQACSTCTPVGGGWACTFVSSGAYNCSLVEGGCLTWNYGCGGGGC